MDHVNTVDEPREHAGQRHNGYTRRLNGQSADEQIVRAPLPLPDDQHIALPSEQWLMERKETGLPGLSQLPIAEHRYKELIDRALQSTREARRVYADEARRLIEDIQWRDTRKAYLQHEEDELIARLNQTEDQYKQREQELKERRNGYWIDAVTSRAMLGETFFTIHWGDRRTHTDGVSETDEPEGIEGPDPDQPTLNAQGAVDDGVTPVSVSGDVPQAPSTEDANTQETVRIEEPSVTLPKIDLSQYPGRIPVELIDVSVEAETENQLNQRDFRAEAEQIVASEGAIAAEMKLLLGAPQEAAPVPPSNWFTKYLWTFTHEQQAWTQFSLLMCSLIFGLSLGMATGFINLSKLQNLQYNWSMGVTAVGFMVLGAGIFYVMGRVIDLFTHLWIKWHLNPSDPTAPEAMANRIRRLAVAFGVVAILGVSLLVITEVIVERQGIVKFVARQSLTGEAVSGWILWAMCLMVSLPFVLFHIADGLIRAAQEAMRTLVRQERACRIDELAAQRRQEAYEPTREHVRAEMIRLRAERDRQHAEQLEAQRQESASRGIEQRFEWLQDVPDIEQIHSPEAVEEALTDRVAQNLQEYITPLRDALHRLEAHSANALADLHDQITNLGEQVGELRTARHETDRQGYHVESQRLMAHVVRLNQEISSLQHRRKQDLEPLRARLELIQQQIRALDTEQHEFHAASRQRQLDAYQTAIQSVQDLDAYTEELQRILEPLIPARTSDGRSTRMRTLRGWRGRIAQWIAGRRIYEPVDTP